VGVGTDVKDLPSTRTCDCIYSFIFDSFQLVAPVEMFGFWKRDGVNEVSQSKVQRR